MATSRVRSRFKASGPMAGPPHQGPSADSPRAASHGSSAAATLRHPEVPASPLEPCLEGFAHHWSIEEAQGPTSRGVCLHCGNVRGFKNTLVEAEGDWQARGFILSPGSWDVESSTDG